MIKQAILLSALIGLTHQAMAASLAAPSNFPVGKPTFTCVAQAAKDHNVPFVILLGVNSIERGNTSQNVGNSNGTLDTGAFQINSIHFPRARELGASHADLSSRGCYNAQFAALLLNEAINQPKKQHLDLYTRAAGYHSWTPKYNTIYRTKLVRYTAEWQRWLDGDLPANQSTQYGNAQAFPVGYSSNNPFIR